MVKSQLLYRLSYKGEKTSWVGRRVSNPRPDEPHSSAPPAELRPTRGKMVPAFTGTAPSPLHPFAVKRAGPSKAGKMEGGPAITGHHGPNFPRTPRRVARGAVHTLDARGVTRPRLVTARIQTI